MRELFPAASWQRIRDTYEAWWTRTLERPVLNLAFKGADPGMPKPDLPVTSLLSKYLNEPAQKIVDMMEYDVRSKHYEADGYPYFWIYFGPMQSIEYFGAKATVMSNTVWYEPKTIVPMDEFHMKIDPDSAFNRKIAEVCAEIDKRFPDGYVGGSPIGGASSLDHLDGFFDSTELLLSFYDYPEDVKRLSLETNLALAENAEKMKQFYTHAKGYTCWGGIFGPEPWMGAQCDMSAMFGPKIFEEFVLPDLKMTYDRSPKYNYYHLDGPGEFVHLPYLLEIENLQAIQYVPHPNEPILSRAQDIFKPISDAGKNIWWVGTLEEMEALADVLGTLKGVYFHGTYDIKDYDRVIKKAEQLMK